MAVMFLRAYQVALHVASHLLRGSVLQVLARQAHVEPKVDLEARRSGVSGMEGLLHGNTNLSLNRFWGESLGFKQSLQDLVLHFVSHDAVGRLTLEQTKHEASQYDVMECEQRRSVGSSEQHH